jgi:hypothetical protein
MRVERNPAEQPMLRTMKPRLSTVLVAVPLAAALWVVDELVVDGPGPRHPRCESAGGYTWCKGETPPSHKTGCFQVPVQDPAPNRTLWPCASDLE